MRLLAARSQVLIVDAQEKLAPALADHAPAVTAMEKLVRGALLVDVPVLASEQYPAGLGITVPPLAALIPPDQRLPKLHFSCQRDVAIRDRLEGEGRMQVVLAGMETHVCVLQTALDLLEAGFAVAVVADAVASRQPDCKKLGLDRMARAGASIVTTEMVLFEWLDKAGTPTFKAMLPLIK